MAEKNAEIKISFRGTARRRPPTQLYICTLICGDRAAGLLMSWLLSWSRHATPKWGREGKWNYNHRADILRGAGLTWKQYRRASRLLIERGCAIIEVGWYSGEKMIFTQPTPAFLAAYASRAGAHADACARVQKSAVTKPLKTKADSGVQGTTRARPGHDQGTTYNFYPSTLLSKEDSESDTDSENHNHSSEHYKRRSPPDGGHDAPGDDLFVGVEPEPAPGVSKYVFHGSVVRLNRHNFDHWRDGFGLDEAGLRALLTQRDDWLASPDVTDAHRKRWFISTSNWLASKARELKTGSSPDGKQHHTAAPRRSARDILHERHGFDLDAETGVEAGSGPTIDLGRDHYSEVA